MHHNNHVSKISPKPADKKNNPDYNLHCPTVHDASPPNIHALVRAQPQYSQQLLGVLATVLMPLVLQGCYATHIQTGAQSGVTMHDRQWFLFGGLAGVSGPAGAECAHGLAYAKSKTAVGDIFLDLLIGVGAASLYAVSTETPNVAVASSLLTVAPWILGSRTVTYGCRLAPAQPRYRRQSGPLPSRTDPPRNGRRITPRQASRDVKEVNCTSSSACIQLGRCTVRAGTCVAVANRDCASAPVCTRLKRCIAKNGRCVAGFPPKPVAAEPVAASRSRPKRTPKRCGGTPACHDQGLCRDLDGSCVAKTNGDCRKAAICRLMAKCRARHGRCVK